MLNIKTLTKNQQAQIAQAIESEHWQIREGAARTGFLTTEQIYQLLEDDCWCVRYAVVLNNKLSDDQRIKAELDNEIKIRIAVAKLNNNIKYYFSDSNYNHVRT